MTYKILIVGIGSIGYRHLESFINHKIKYDITIVDKSKTSLKLSRIKWDRDTMNMSNHKVHWQNNIKFKKKIFDLAIISTGSNNRANLIKKISNVVKVRYWILEKIIGQSINDLKIIKYVTRYSSAVYINLPRREMELYKRIRMKLNFRKINFIQKFSNNWALACNSIHFIDLACWLTKQHILNINTEYLETKWFSSKRKGYYEINGKLITKFSGGAKLILKNSASVKSNYFLIKMEDNVIWKINEKKGLAVSSNGEIIQGRYTLQSEMTSKIVTRILTKKKIKLTSLEESIKHHEFFLKKMLIHWNKSRGLNSIKVPIT